MVFSAQPIGTVNLAEGRGRTCPLVAKTAGEATLHIFQDHAAGLRGLFPGQDIWVLTYRTRSAPDVPDQGVFATQSAARPNPIDFLRARVLEVTPDLGLILIQGYDGEEGAPILDIRPAVLPLHPLT